MSAWRCCFLLTALVSLVAAPVRASDPPAKPTESGTLPEPHGIAVFGMRLHHADVATMLVDGDGQPSTSAKRLRSELALQADQLPKLLEGLAKAAESLGAAQDAASAEKSMDMAE